MGSMVVLAAWCRPNTSAALSGLFARIVVRGCGCAVAAALVAAVVLDTVVGAEAVDGVVGTVDVGAPVAASLASASCK